MDSMIWNWYCKPVAFAATLPFFALSTAFAGPSEVVVGAAAVSSSGWNLSKFSPNISISRMILSDADCRII